jgi:hypothetical protein
MSRGDAPDRLMSWTRERPARIRGHNPWLVTVGVAQRFVDVRVTGLAAEMTYFALLSLVPLLVALGAGLGLLERLLGPEQVIRLEDTMITALAAVFSPDVTSEVMAPLVRSLLREERAGLAVGSLLVTFWLASRVFRAAIRALDDAYGVEERARVDHAVAALRTSPHLLKPRGVRCLLDRVSDRSLRKSRQRQASGSRGCVEVIREVHADFRHRRPLWVYP